MRVVVCSGRTALAVLLAGAVAFVSLAVVAKHKLIPAFAQTKQHPIYQVALPEGDRRISLGFNCAWDAEDVPEILDALADANVRATFFLQGQWTQTNQEAAKAIQAAGHELGSHSYSHADLAKLSPEEISQEATKSAQVIRDVTGEAVDLFRVPSGSYNNTVIETLTQLGYTPVQWNIDSRDWKDPSLEKLISNCVDHTQPGSILLLHCGAEKTAQALPQILKSLQEAGYELVPIGELIYRQNYQIDSRGIQSQPQAS